MNFEQVKKLLKDGYELAGFDVVAVADNGEIHLRYPEPDLADVMLRITNEDIQEYAELLDAQHEFMTTPAPCSFANASFREHLLLPLDASINERDLRDFFFKRQGTDTYVEIDSASPVFANFFRFNDGYMQLCLDRIMALPRRYREQSNQQPLDIRMTLARPLTIRVYNMEAGSVDEAVRMSDEWIESSLFALAYHYQTPVMLAQDFPTSRYARRKTMRRNDHKLDRLIMPNAGFRKDLVRLYQAGLASPIAAQQFLAYYSILEFFFQDVNHNAAYAPLRSLLMDTQFTPSEETLTRIIQIVAGSDKEQAAENLLEQLIRQTIDPDVLRDAILSFGSVEETIRAMARRLVEVRAAIINTGSGGLPLDDSSIKRDIPLVKYLAEQVIVATVG